MDLQRNGQFLVVVIAIFICEIWTQLGKQSRCRLFSAALLNYQYGLVRNIGITICDGMDSIGNNKNPALRLSPGPQFKLNFQQPRTSVK
jgi:hypothetical protein